MSGPADETPRPRIPDGLREELSNLAPQELEAIQKGLAKALAGDPVRHMDRLLAYQLQASEGASHEDEDESANK